MIFPFQGISRDFSFFLLLEAFRKKKILYQIQNFIYSKVFYCSVVL